MSCSGATMSGETRDIFWSVVMDQDKVHSKKSPEAVPSSPVATPSKTPAVPTKPGLQDRPLTEHRSFTPINQAATSLPADLSNYAAAASRKPEKRRPRSSLWFTEERGRIVPGDQVVSRAGIDVTGHSHSIDVPRLPPRPLSPNTHEQIRRLLTTDRTRSPGSFYRRFDR